MFWKIYFWVYIVMTALGTIVLLPQLFEFLTLVSVLLSFMLILGTYSYAYQKPLAKPLTWKIFFLFNLAFIITDIAVSLSYSFQDLIGIYQEITTGNILMVLLQLLIDLPGMIALFILAFRIPNLKK